MGQKIKRPQILRAIVLACILAFTHPLAWAGGVQEEQPTSVEVVLHGVGNFETVQLFDFLLRQLPGLVVVDQTGMQLDPLEPINSRSGWSVKVYGNSADQLQEELMAEIRELDPEKQNDSLYEAPFLVTTDALNEVKTIIPAQLTTHRVDFSPEAMVVSGRAQFTDPQASSQQHLVWYKQHGMGFE